MFRLFILFCVSGEEMKRERKIIRSWNKQASEHTRTRKCDENETHTRAQVERETQQAKEVNTV